MDPLIKQVPWVTKIGHELTFVPTKRFTASEKNEIIAGEHYWNGYDNLVTSKVCSLRSSAAHKNIMYNSIHNDCGCVEITSKPIASWKTFINWNVKVRDVAKDIALTNKLDWLAGGMGHHHIDYQLPHVNDNLFRIVAERPYLAWMFVDPEDTKNCRSVASWFIEYEHNRLTGCFRTYFDPRVCWNDEYLRPSGRLCCLSDRGETIEWRAFDSAEDMTMQIEHTAFLQALVGYAKKTATPKTVKQQKEGMFKSVKHAEDTLKRYQDPSLCAKEFIEFIEIIGLPTARYRRYIDMNLKPRLRLRNGV